MFVLPISDSLPAVWERDADMGVLPRLCHSLLCVPVAACPSCMLPCQDTADQQGKIDEVSHVRLIHNISSLIKPFRLVFLFHQ